MPPYLCVVISHDDLHTGTKAVTQHVVISKASEMKGSYGDSKAAGQIGRINELFLTANHSRKMKQERIGHKNIRHSLLCWYM